VSPICHCNFGSAPSEMQGLALAQWPELMMSEQELRRKDHTADFWCALLTFQMSQKWCILNLYIIKIALRRAFLGGLALSGQERRAASTKEKSLTIISQCAKGVLSNVIRTHSRMEF
jgi:hypothetical protein